MKPLQFIKKINHSQMWVLCYWRGRIMDLKYQPIPSPRVSFHLSTLRLMPQQQLWSVLTLQEEGRQRDAARAKVSSLFGFILGASLVVQWLRIHLPLQGTWVRSLVQEQRSHVPRVTKPMPATTTEPCTPWSPRPRQETPPARKAASTARQSPHAAVKMQHTLQTQERKERKQAY